MDNLTPQQINFLTYYTDPKSDTFSNARQSAIRAGYTVEYAENITSLMPDWLSEAMGRRKRMLDRAEKRLEEFIEHEDPKLAQDTVKFVTRTLGKEFYSERSELTGKDGKDLKITFDNVFSDSASPEAERNNQTSG